MILSIVRGYFKSLFGKKTNTRETWKTGFKPNILEVNLKDLTSKKKKEKDNKKKRERGRKNTQGKKKEKKWNAKHVSFQWFSKKKKCYSTRLNSSNIPRQCCPSLV